MKSNLTLVLLLFFNFIVAQKRSANCEDIYAAAEKLFESGKYDMAIKKISAYKLCNEKGTKNADILLLKIFETVNRQKEEAIKSNKEAIRQRNIANNRANIISRQKDSIERENISNIVATKSLQINEIDPNRALQFIYKGLCISPNNLALNEIRRKILNEEILFELNETTGPYSITNIKELQTDRFITADDGGEIKLWNHNNELLSKFRLFNSRISSFDIVDENRIIAAGTDSDGNKVKLLNLNTGSIAVIENEIAATRIGSVVVTNNGKDCYFGNDAKEVFFIDLTTLKCTKYKNVPYPILNFQYWKEFDKIFYADSFGVYDLKTAAAIYKAPENISITSLGLCQSTGDLYIAMGNKLLLFNAKTNTQQLLSQLHTSVITSCNCAEGKGGFLTTSLDTTAALWDASGNLITQMKGNKVEIYDGIIGADGDFAVTVGRAEMGNTSSGTMKYWYLNNFLKRKKEAHRFGATAILAIPQSKLLLTSGINGIISTWDENLNLLYTKKISDEALSSLAVKDQNLIVFGTYSGATGTIAISGKGEILEFTAAKTNERAVNAVASAKGIIFSAGSDGKLTVQNSDGTFKNQSFTAKIQDVCISPGQKSALLAIGKTVINYDWSNGTKTVYNQTIDINKLAWIDENKFVSVSGQFLWIWNIRNKANPLLKIDNNTENPMTSIYVDRINKYIYTGTWKGNISCWDYSGKKLFEWKQLTIESSNHINAICGNSDNSIIYTVDYNGNIAQWSGPKTFINTELKIDTSCDDIKRLLKK
jgi:WD40 repeat protein